MKTTSKLFVFGAVAVVLLAAAVLLQPALARSLQQETETPTAQSTDAVTPTAIPTRLAEVWAQFCAVSQQISYVLVALPENATFDIVQAVKETPTPGVTSTAQTPTPAVVTESPTLDTTETPAVGETVTPRDIVIAGDAVCTSLETVNGKQLVLCTGPELSVITLSVTSGDVTEELPIMPPACPAQFPSPTPEPVDVTPSAIVPTIPVLPTDTPALSSPTPAPISPVP
jgi:hypothetical protein